MRFPVGQAYRVAVGVGFPAQRAAHPVLWRRHMAGDGFSHSKKGEKNIAKNTLKILSGFPG
jgi:hypothetical protein